MAHPPPASPVCARSRVREPNSSNSACSSTTPSRWNAWPPKSSTKCRTIKSGLCSVAYLERKQTLMGAIPPKDVNLFKKSAQQVESLPSIARLLSDLLRDDEARA